MWSAIASIVLGALGWAIAKLLFEPMKEIVDLRRETQECLIVHGNLPKDAPSEERRAAAESFRRIGAGLVSRHIAAYPWVSWWCRACLGWDIHSAGAFLIGIGNSTQFDGFSFASVSPTVSFIWKSLRLPDPEKPPMIRELQAHAAQPAPIAPNAL